MSKFSEPIVLAHISDLHFGDVLANNQFSYRSRVLHYPPHDFNLCLEFPNALEYIRVNLLDLSDEDTINLVLSGDMTNTGTQTEFAVAHAILRSKLKVRRTGVDRYAGFSLKDDQIGAVPGNHDHFNGLQFMHRPRAYTPSIFPDHFRQTPWVKEWRSLSGKLILEIHGIDSNSGLAPKRTNLRAKGAFSTRELDLLEENLKKSDARGAEPGTLRVRALVTHHSLMFAGVGAMVFGAVALEDASRDSLLDLAAKYKIPVILTGHTHDSNFHPHPVTDPDGILSEVWELRSATTFQGPAQSNKQGFWCHVVWLSDEGPRWYGWRFHWAANCFMIRRLKPDVDILLPGV